MSNYTLDFLNNLNPELAELGRSIDDIFYDDPHGVLVKSRLFAELLTKSVASFEQMDELNHLRQVERISQLDKEGILSREVAQAFDTIRYIGNRASHADAKGDLEQAIKIHKNLFKIAVWYMEVYGDHEFTAPTYTHPSPRKSEGIDHSALNKLIEGTLTKQLAAILKNDFTNNEEHLGEDDAIHKDMVNGDVEKEDVQEAPIDEPTIEEAANQEATIDDEPVEGETMYGSYLLYELSKLRESSQEAVEGSTAFSPFKKYLHVERPIQMDFEKTLQRAASEEGSQLILLCGSVGDGKSHLLAYMNEEYPQLMASFNVHNDATESFDPQKNSLDTLAEVLKPFSDADIEQTDEKLILAINLGVLHNFLESEYAKNSYTKLIDFIHQSEVFEVAQITKQVDEPHFNLVSFSDYHPYELTKEGPKSDYFRRVLEKVVDHIPENPFYAAFLKDKKNKIEAPFMTNYVMLHNESVREKIAQLLIQAIIQHKYILSTRTLLNVIHDMLVPANLEDHLTSTSVIDETQVLLPNLLYGSAERSPLLKVIAKLDPIHVRSEEIDQALIELNNSFNISQVFKSYLTLEGLESWGEALSDLGPFYELTKATRRLMNKTLIRFAYFLSDEMERVFENDTYHRYMSYLYAYNVGIPVRLKGIYEEVEQAVFAWNGTPNPNSNYIYLDESIGSMKIAQELDLRKYAKHLTERDEDVFYRFKHTIVIGFQDQNETRHALLDIDYPLYETIVKVLNGYRPNKKDKENAIQFLEFIDKLMKLGNREKEIVIYESTGDMLFKLEFEPDFKEFTFRRG